MKKDPLTYFVIGEAMATHSGIGPGLGEDLYHQQLFRRLKEGGIECRSKRRSDLYYKGIVVDIFEPDLLIENKLVIELKSVVAGFSGEHFTQILCYQKFFKIRTGLLLNFGRESLVKKRIVYESRTGNFDCPEIPEFVTSAELAENLSVLANNCVKETGLGYRETTWFSILVVELGLAGISCTQNPTAKVMHQTNHVFSCIVVEDQCAITVGALGEGVSPADRAHLQTYLKWLNLPWGIAFHFGKASCDLKFVRNPT